MSEFRIDQIKSQDATRGPDVAGITTFTGTSGIVMPSGNTAYRGGRDRGIIFGGFLSPANINGIDYITISTTGDSVSFGDLSETADSSAAFASSTRGLCAGGARTPSRSNSNLIDYITISSTGNAFDFGDLASGSLYQGAGCSNNTRGVIYTNAGAPASQHYIDYVEIATKGNAIVFGEAFYPPDANRSGVGAVSNSTRGLFAGGGYPTVTNTIEYLTFSTLGSSADFGDLLNPVRYPIACSSSTRGVFYETGPRSPFSPAAVNVISYVTINSLGNAVDFGDGNASSAYGGCSNQIRGAFAGVGPSPYVNIEYVTIATTGNPTDFGDISSGATSDMMSTSDCHGGIG